MADWQGVDDASPAIFQNPLDPASWNLNQTPTRGRVLRDKAGNIVIIPVVAVNPGQNPITANSYISTQTAQKWVGYFDPSGLISAVVANPLSSAVISPYNADYLDESTSFKVTTTGQGSATQLAGQRAVDLGLRGPGLITALDCWMGSQHVFVDATVGTKYFKWTVQLFDNTTAQGNIPLSSEVTIGTATSTGTNNAWIDIVTKGTANMGFRIVDGSLSKTTSQHIAPVAFQGAPLIQVNGYVGGPNTATVGNGFVWNGNNDGFSVSYNAKVR